MTVGKGVASFHAMAELKQIAAEELNVTSINTTGYPSNRGIGLPLNPSFLKMSKRPPFGRRHQF